MLVAGGNAEPWGTVAVRIAVVAVVHEHVTPAGHSMHMWAITPSSMIHLRRSGWNEHKHENWVWWHVVGIRIEQLPGTSNGCQHRPLCRRSSLHGRRMNVLTVLWVVGMVLWFACHSTGCSRMLSGWCCCDFGRDRLCLVWHSQD